MRRLRIHPSGLSSKKCCLFGLLSARYFSFWILVLAALLRFWALDLKPPHFDEGINGWFADRLREQGFYAYDPTNYHGPLYFYILFLVQTLFGRNLWVLRAPAVLGSLASVLLALRFKRFFGKRVAYWGALTVAVSPAMVFYGRYAIHESWVVASLMILVLGLFGLWNQGDRPSLFLSLLGGTLLALLKETMVIHLGSLLIAVVFLLLGHRLLLTSPTNMAESSSFFAKQSWTKRDLFTGCFFSLVALFFFYSGGFLHLRGFLDLFHTLPAWIHTGVRTGGHLKTTYQRGPFNYYWLFLMSHYEMASFLGFLYSVWLLGKNSVVRLSCFSHVTNPSNSSPTLLPAAAIYDKQETFIYFLALYAIATLIIYSFIPYKTPWCLISILWPFSLLFGVFLKQLKKSRAALLAAFTLVLSLFLCVRLNFWHYADFSEPYVYVQTSPEINRFTTPLLSIAKRDPRHFHLRGQVLLESYYPIPWMLGDFTSIGYFSKECPPKKLDGDFILVEASRSPEIQKQLHEPYYRKEFQLRDAMEKCVVYFKKSVFEPFFRDTNDTPLFF